MTINNLLVPITGSVNVVAVPNSHDRGQELLTVQSPETSVRSRLNAWALRQPVIPKKIVEPSDIPQCGIF